MIPVDKPIIMGETAFHHQGDKEFLISLINAAESLSLDVVKFHLLFDIDDYMISEHEAKAVLQKLCIPESDWNELFSLIKKKKLKVVFLCNDVRSLDWVINQDDENILAIEIHATGINDIFLLEKASISKQTVILGSGGSSLDEISYAVNYLRNKGKTDIFLMHGFQNYPTQYADVVLSKMTTLHQLFNLPVGYADHTDPKDPNNEIISCLGLELGFNVIEKHFTTVPEEKRIDSQSAVSVDQMKRIKELAQIVWSTRGSDVLHMSAAETKYGDTGPMKKAIVARKHIKEGETIDLSHLAYKRTNRSTYLKQNSINHLVGQVAKRDIMKDEFVDFSNVDFSFKTGNFDQFKANQK